MMTTQQAAGEKSGTNKNAVGIKETITSLIIAFMLAFLFRGFVVEGFQIPTGSMAPTLMGKHIRMTSPYSGYDWAVGPWTYADTRTRTRPVRQQVDIQVNDPMSGLQINETNRRLAAGDRVFVLKYLPFLQSPKRWDVVVFKNPGTHENYIKRLIGLPGEQLAIIDGDVFSRQSTKEKVEESGWDAWEDDDWQIARKSERTQRTMFLDVFDSKYVPVEAEPAFHTPFAGLTSGWEGLSTESSYRFGGEGETALVWNMSREITDANAYNQTHARFDPFARSDDLRKDRRPFPVSDIAIKLSIEPDGEPMKVSPVLEARGMLFRATVDAAQGQVALEMRSVDELETQWTQIDAGSMDMVKAGEMFSVEFWHVDQAMWLFVNGKLVCGGAEKGGYVLSPAQRASRATGKSWDELREFSAGDGVKTSGVFARSEMYRKPTFRWEFSGGPFTLHNVSVKRDIAYRISSYVPTRGGHPDNFPTMTDEEYFMCGDNSSNSLDSRLWRNGSINKWVEHEIDDRVGMVHQDLIVGKAFLVYFPAPLDGGPVLAPDVGRTRWIW